MPLESMINSPKVSVIMPAYNAQMYIKHAIDSILNQTFSDFELIIINDGSTDKTEEIINSYNDSRIINVYNHDNFGLSYSLNLGIRKASGEYIARMDADDISAQDRFKDQLAFMQKNPKIDILGSSVFVIKDNGKSKGILNRPTTHTEIKWFSLFSTPMYHPTIMARAEVLKNNPYSLNLSNSEDYELWSRLLFTSSIYFANLKKPLLYYRSFDNSTTQKLDAEKKITSINNSISNIEHYSTLSPTEKKILLSVYQNKPLRLLELAHHWNIYFRSAASFCKIEKLNYLDSIRIYKRLLSHALFLIKYKIRSLRRFFS
jgi:glycosyltransferase involved in cell wall biosynthesis